MARHTTSVPANPEVIQWARAQAKMRPADVEDRSKLSKLDQARLKDIETGESEPTISEVMEFARLFKRPFALFFLPEPPSPIPTIPDGRSGAAHGTEFGEDLNAAIARAYEVQETIVDLSTTAHNSLPDIPSPSSQYKSDAEKLASWARSRLGIDKVFVKSRRVAEDALVEG